MMFLEECARLLDDFSGSLGLWARNIDTGETLAWNENELFPTASTIKVPILYELYRQYLSEQLNIDTRVPLREEDKVPGSGVLRELDADVQLTLRDLAKLMIVVSDNTAANLLIDRLGLEKINHSMKKIGLTEIRLENRFFQVTTEGKFSQATPIAFGKLLEQIALHQTLTPPLCEEVLDTMKRQQNKFNLVRYLPAGQGVVPVVASKNGSNTGIRNEIGVVWLKDQRYVISLMSKECADHRFILDNEASILLAKLSRLVFDTFSNQERLPNYV